MSTVRSGIRMSAFGALATVALASGQQVATAQQVGQACGEFYRVQRGDTLRALTVRTYGHDRYLELFRANKDILANPAEIEVGQLLYLPCAGQSAATRLEALQRTGRRPSTIDQLGTRLARRSGPEQTVRVAIVTPDATENSLPKPGSRGIRQESPQLQESGIARGSTATPGVQERSRAEAASSLPQKVTLLSASGMAPLADEALPDGGLIGAVIREAFRQSAPFMQIETAFVDDRAAHLDVLLPMNVFGLSYPWPAPDCSGAGAAGPVTRTICNAFDVSLPIYKVEMRFLTRDESAVLGSKRLTDLNGRSICRAEDFPPVDLERLGIGTRVVVKRDLSACIEAVRRGEVDVLSAPAPALEAEPVKPQLSEVTSLRREEPVHALFARASPTSPELMAKLNSGLRSLQSSGVWFDTVAGYLSDFNRNRALASN
ncbi:MAG: hypothetical protein AAF479_03450 [Pseudomonadota bacterium]